MEENKQLRNSTTHDHISHAGADGDADKYK